MLIATEGDFGAVGIAPCLIMLGAGLPSIIGYIHVISLVSDIVYQSASK